MSVYICIYYELINMYLFKVPQNVYNWYNGIYFENSHFVKSKFYSNSSLQGLRPNQHEWSIGYIWAISTESKPLKRLYLASLAAYDCSNYVWCLLTMYQKFEIILKNTVTEIKNISVKLRYLTEYFSKTTEKRCKRKPFFPLNYW